MSEKRLSECGDTYPLWTVDSLWQGNIPRPRTKQPLDIRACNEHNLSESSAITELNEVKKICEIVCHLQYYIKFTAKRRRA